MVYLSAPGLAVWGKALDQVGLLGAVLCSIGRHYLEMQTLYGLYVILLFFTVIISKASLVRPL